MFGLKYEIRYYFKYHKIHAFWIFWDNFNLSKQELSRDQFMTNRIKGCLPHGGSTPRSHPTQERKYILSGLSNRIY